MDQPTGYELLSLAVSGVALAGSLAPFLVPPSIRSRFSARSSPAPAATSTPPSSSSPTYPTGTFLPTDADQAALERQLREAEDGLVTGGDDAPSARHPYLLRPSAVSGSSGRPGSSGSRRPSTGRRF